ncbi:MAG TPA: antibiotic biosynthesis monooxygenase [Stellaceae bacterium]|nr:antibiotic biosynthesis monooxygenase [Stellaceae bacterium]
MAITVIAPALKLATGINVFTLPAERQPELIKTLHAISNEIITHKYPMNVAANFHRGIDAPIVINYNQYNDRKSGQFLRTQPVAKALLDKTHELSDKHELRWYEVEEVVTTEAPSDRLEISETRHNLAVIGIWAVEPAQQNDLLALLRHYGEAVKAARAPGFIGLATHRGFKPEHVASYEQWASAENYRQATDHGAAAEALAQMRAIALEASLHCYDVLSVQRFDLDQPATM